MLGVRREKMAKNLVVKDNALINASYNLELVEQRLILLSIVEARATGKGITPNNKLTVTANSYMNHYNTNRNASYKALKQACKNLFERQFSYLETNDKGNVEMVRSRWVSEIRYIENEASVKLIFSPSVAPLITMLEKNFTSYEIGQVSELNSKYSVRLYEIVIAWRSVGKTPMIEMDKLRQRLGVLDDEYTVTADFKRWVLDKSIQQINKKTSIIISYEQHKQGRKIVGFTFTITQKTFQPESELPAKAKAAPNPDLFAEFSEMERAAIQERIADHITRLEATGEIVSDFHRENITKKAVAERWGVDVLQKKNNKKQKSEKKTAMEQAWHEVPNGTHFRHTKDGSIWRKDAGCLVDKQNRFVPEFLIIEVFQYLEEI